jgi:hypothetical protein
MKTPAFPWNKNTPGSGGTEVVNVEAAYWKRVLLLSLGALVVLSLAGAIGYHFFAGWRAGNLAADARKNIDEANYQLAWRQVSLARNLRPEDPEVLAVAGLIEASAGMPQAMETYELLASKAELAPADLAARATAAARHGTEEQFSQAADALAAAGKPAEAAKLRMARKLSRGDLERAITEARAALLTTDDPATRLALARLLQTRHGRALAAGGDNPEAVAAGQEFVALVEGLRGTAMQGQALALGLGADWVRATTMMAWTDAAIADRRADNPALLLAGSRLLSRERATATDLAEQLQPVFAAADLGERVTFVQWLTMVGLPHAALEVLTADEAASDNAAFIAQTEALFRAGRPADIIELADRTTGGVDEDIRLGARSRAEYETGRSGADSLAGAMEAAARAGRLERAVAIGESAGASLAVDKILIRMCGAQALADESFRVARDRFGRKGMFSLVDEAYQRAREADPASRQVIDHGRHLRLIAGEAVDPAETQATVDLDPANPDFRATHALALLAAGQATEALAVYDDIVVYAPAMPPAQQAVVAAVLAAAGDTASAESIAQSADPALLRPDELALLQRAGLTGLQR